MKAHLIRAGLPFGALLFLSLIPLLAVPGAKEMMHPLTPLLFLAVVPTTLWLFTTAGVRQWASGAYRAIARRCGDLRKKVKLRRHERTLVRI